MFKSEAEMAEPVKRWMKESLGLLVKSEFISPWGICDFVGLRFRKQSVARRLKLGQKGAVTSTSRAALLLQIPDIETNRSVTFSDLIAACSPAISGELIMVESQALVAGKFVIQEGDRFQKVNGWMPLARRLIAVELKLKRVEEAMAQAQNNLGFTNESYVGLPMDLATRIAGSGKKNDFIKRGIGLIGTTSQTCKMLIRSRGSGASNPVFQFCCVEKFWRSLVKGS